MSFKLLNLQQFKQYLESLNVTRKVTRVQLHHTYSPNYSNFNGNNHLRLQQSMKEYHINTNGWSDIGQHFTIFPDGLICTGRDVNSNPAGIKGGNTGSVCIECLGNFDTGKDIMLNAQKDSIIGVTKLLLDMFKLNPVSDVTYHAWWTSSGKSLGDYVKGKSAKTCPGTNFFEGNTVKAYKNNLLPLIQDYGKPGLKPITEINDIVWELMNAGVVTDGKLWLKNCEEDRNVYWLCRKMANKLRGTLN